MAQQDKTRMALRRLIAERGVDMSAVSKAIGKNHAYIQQYLMRGVPADLSYKTALALSDYFGCGLDLFGMKVGPARPASGTRPRHPVQSVRRLMGLSPAQFARALGEKESDIQAVEDGKAPLDEKLTLKICTTFEIDPADLAPLPPALTAEERIILLRMRGLSAAQRRALDAFFRKCEKE